MSEKVILTKKTFWLKMKTVPPVSCFYNAGFTDDIIVIPL